MQPVPSALRTAFTDIDQSAIDAWWAGLPDESRSDVTRLCDERLDACFFGVATADGEAVPKVRGGRFVPTDDTWGLEEWGPGYFEHLMQHPELVLVWEPPEPKLAFGCTRHPLARACWINGRVPADFACPFSSGSDCLMQQLLGRTIRWCRVVKR